MVSDDRFQCFGNFHIYILQMHWSPAIYLRCGWSLGTNSAILLSAQCQLAEGASKSYLTVYSKSWSCFLREKKKILFSINQMWAVSLSCFLSWCRPLYTGSRKSLAALISSWADEDWGLNEIHLQNETTMIYVKLKTEDSYHILKMVIAEIDF